MPRMALMGVGGSAGCLPYSQIDGALSAGAIFVHIADGVIAWTQITSHASNFDEMRFRIQDASNYWVIFVGGGNPGSVYLSEVVAAVKTDRAWALGVIPSSHRVALVLSGSTITVYSGVIGGSLTQRCTYASATNFATFTDGKLQLLLGAISDLKTWTLACRASEGV